MTRGKFALPNKASDAEAAEQCYAYRPKDGILPSEEKERSG